MLTADELEGMTAVQEENLPDTLAVITLEWTRDARGNATEVAVTGDWISCRVKPVSQATSSAQEAVVLEKIGVIDAWKIRLPKGAISDGTNPIRLQDRVFVDVAGSGGRMMEIVAAPNLKSYQSIDTLYAVEIR